MDTEFQGPILGPPGSGSKYLIHFLGFKSHLYSRHGHVTCAVIQGPMLEVSAWFNAWLSPT